MTVEELKVYLKEKHVPKSEYNINDDGTHKDLGTVVLETGTAAICVYVAERNEMYDYKVFTGESAAVDYFLKLMAID